MTIKLYGFCVSNYYNVAKLALLEKNIPFEEVPYSPAEKTQELLSMSPAGKIPFLEVDGHFFSESQVILRYLETLVPQPALVPGEPFAAARADQIHQFLDLYVDLNARPLLGAAFFGKSADGAQIAEAGEKVEVAIGALARIVSFDPFIAGNQMTHADLAAVMHLDLAGHILTALGQDDPALKLPGYTAYREGMGARPAFAKVLAERDEAVQNLLAKPTS